MRELVLLGLVGCAPAGPSLDGVYGFTIDHALRADVNGTPVFVAFSVDQDVTCATAAGADLAEEDCFGLGVLQNGSLGAGAAFPAHRTAVITPWSGFGVGTQAGVQVTTCDDGHLDQATASDTVTFHDDATSSHVEIGLPVDTDADTDSATAHAVHLVQGSFDAERCFPD